MQHRALWWAVMGLINYNSQLFPGRNKAWTMEGVISDIHHLPAELACHTEHCFPFWPESGRDTLIGPDPSRYWALIGGDHYSQLSQLEAPKWEHFLPFAVSYWYETVYDSVYVHQSHPWAVSLWHRKTDLSHILWISDIEWTSLDQQSSSVPPISPRLGRLEWSMRRHHWSIKRTKPNKTDFLINYYRYLCFYCVMWWRFYDIFIFQFVSVRVKK